jgi:cytochrome c-type biogenesis protein CcmH
MTRRRGARALVLAALLAGLAAGSPAAPVDDDAVARVASQLRCVVCQNLSVADSPSEMARQMRELVRERLARGDSPEAVKAYFVEKYGEWVLLAPPARGFNLVLWGVPFAALLVGLALVAALMRRWTRRPAAGRPVAEAPVGAAEHERIAAELRRLGE